MRQADHQPRLPQNGKGPAEPTRPFGTHIPTGVPIMSLSGSELEPPPSYDNPIHDWRAGVAQ